MINKENIKSKNSKGFTNSWEMKIKKTTLTNSYKHINIKKNQKNRIRIEK